MLAKQIQNKNDSESSRGERPQEKQNIVFISYPKFLINTLHWRQWGFPIFIAFVLIKTDSYFLKIIFMRHCRFWSSSIVCQSEYTGSDTYLHRTNFLSYALIFLGKKSGHFQNFYFSCGANHRRTEKLSSDSLGHWAFFAKVSTQKDSSWLSPNSLCQQPDFLFFRAFLAGLPYTSRKFWRSEKIITLCAKDIFLALKRF